MIGAPFIICSRCKQGWEGVPKGKGMVRGGKSRAGDGEGGVIVTSTATIAVAAEAVIDIFHEHIPSMYRELK